MVGFDMGGRYHKIEVTSSADLLFRSAAFTCRWRQAANLQEVCAPGPQSAARFAWRGSNRMSKRVPVARARRSRVRIEGRARPPSSRARTGCVVPIFRANSACVRPTRFRASSTALAKPNSPSRAWYALWYSGSSIHLLCMSDIRGTGTPSFLMNRFCAGKRQLDLASWCLLRLFHEDPHNYNSRASGRHIECPRNSTAALKPHFPEAAFKVLQTYMSASLSVKHGPVV